MNKKKQSHPKAPTARTQNKLDITKGDKYYVKRQNNMRRSAEATAPARGPTKRRNDPLN
jgi:hypothetical protein